jgi:hypothetical protein
MPALDIIYYSFFKKVVAPACHGEERRDEAIQLDRHGALRAPRDDKPWGYGHGLI